MADEININELKEEDFLKSEINKGKAIIITYIAGILEGFLSGYLEILGLTILSILSAFAVIFILIYFLKERYRNLSSSTIAWIIILYILSWITFWIISLNPPFF